MSTPIAILPLKQCKGTDLGGGLVRLLEERCNAGDKPLSAEAKDGAAALHKAREKLEHLDKLTPYTAEDAAKEYVRYQAEIGRLSDRFDKFGTELNVPFKWRDAWKPSKKCEHADLEWERVGALFAAASAYSYCASLAQPRGVREGGLKEACKLFQQASGCLSAAHDLTKSAIWGLEPRWRPDSLTGDVQLPMLLALRQLMLAQAQRAFYEKGAPTCAPCTPSLAHGPRSTGLCAPCRPVPPRAALCRPVRSGPCLPRRRCRGRLDQLARKAERGRRGALRRRRRQVPREQRDGGKRDH